MELTMHPPPNPSLEFSRLEDLPTELLEPIIAAFSPADLKILRLTCKRLELLSARRLFRIARISFLKEDRETFLGISSRPHLRIHVKALIWYECHLWIPRDDKVTSWASWYDRFEDADIISAYQEALWSPIDRSGDEALGINFPEAAFQEFSGQFTTALLLMPNLKIIMSDMIPSDRIVTAIPFPLTALSLRCIRLTPHSHGLITMLRAALETEIDLTSLYWNDADTETLEYITNHSEFEGVFGKLRSVDISFTDFNQDAGVQSLQAALRAATELQKLRICFENSDQSSDTYTLDLFSQYFWPHLFSLVLVDLSIRQKDLLSFLKSHAKTLRQLSLEKCLLYRIQPATTRHSDGCWTEFLQGAAQIKELHLDSFHFASPSGEEILANDQDLLRFLNKEQEDLSNELWWNLCLRTHSCGCCVSGNHDWLNNEPTWDISGWESPEDDTSIYRPDRSDSNTTFVSEALLTDWLDSPSELWTIRWINGSIVFWNILPEEIAKTEPLDTYPTEIWEFRSREGIVALGSNPFDFFTTWDAGAGDVATPTPLGREMEKLQEDEDYSDSEAVDRRNNPTVTYDFPPHAQVLVNFEDGWSPRLFSEYQLECSVKGKLPGRYGFNMSVQRDLSGPIPFVGQLRSVKTALLASRAAEEGTVQLEQRIRKLEERNRQLEDENYLYSVQIHNLSPFRSNERRG